MELTTGEAAARLGVTPQAVGGYIRDGDLVAKKQPKGKDWYWVIELSDLETFALQHGYRLKDLEA